MKSALDYEIIDYFSLGLTKQQVADELGCSVGRVTKIWDETFPLVQLKEHKSANYARSKYGEKNPMLGKFGEDHPGYKGVIDDCKGYKIILKPNWYTGRPGSRHVFHHHVVMCEALGITEIPEGWDVHHIDEDKTNNDLGNLSLMIKPAHQKLHWIQRRMKRDS